MSGRFDLPIALGILAASGHIPGRELDKFEFAGELSLSGQLRPIRGALAMTFAMHRCPERCARSFILPAANADEAALVSDAMIYHAETLLQVCAHFAAADQGSRLARHRHKPSSEPPAYPDFSDVKGQQRAKRAMEVAAADSHSLLPVCTADPTRTVSVFVLRIGVP